MFDRLSVTDLVLHGDTRPYHREAVKQAEARGITVHVTELGLLRPGFLTHETGGLVTLSRFPDDPAAIRAIAKEAPSPDLTRRYPGSFMLEAWQDVSYHLVTLATSVFFPRYERHTPQHPLADYARWCLRLARAPGRRRRASREQSELLASSKPFFVLPLQVEGDYQLLAHSPFSSMRQAVDRVLGSFARSAPAHVRLVIKTHPLDNGIRNWRHEIGEATRELGVQDRVHLLDGGDLGALLARAAGCVTVNSTSGLEAIMRGTAVRLLAPALFDVEGLVDRQPLDGFWHVPQAPDPDLTDALVRALAATTQFRGSIHNLEGLEEAVERLTERLLRPTRPVAAWVCEPPPRLARARAQGVPL
jgi:capsular polysaccharide export protein